MRKRNMTETQQQQHQRINWIKSAANVALGIWGVATYLAVLAGIAWVAVKIGHPSLKMSALMAVVLSTFMHWAVFAGIERATRD